ncbi:hypothetical protein F2Q70_00011891 [Brassica cretica]|uniref:Uncharacterized protein n=1 Tax=Brassica cretica TaxID=69181 RepID=A0A8S9LZ81_BRACR|nr:hypothetical protein F2Q70_00011891 [Brassica cretica]
MKRPTDAYKETHNQTLALEDTLFGVAAKELTPVTIEPVTQEPTAPTEDEAHVEVKDVKPRPLSPFLPLGATKAKEVEATQVPEVEVTQVPVETNVVTVSENLVDANVPEAVEFGLNESIQYV